MKGWLAGCGAASGVISTFIVVLQAIASGGNLMLFMGGSLAVLFPALLVFVVTCLLTAIPAAFVFWLSEKFAIRSILFLCVCRRRYRSIEPSGSAGAMFRRGPPQVNWLFVVAGFVAGVVYWRIAGRHAGRDREAPGLSA
jgi:hypothetical protein